MYKRLTNDIGQISGVGSKYVERIEDVLTPIFQEMMDEGYDMSDIRVIRDEAMRYQLCKMMMKRMQKVKEEE